MALSDRKIFELWDRRKTLKARATTFSKKASDIDQKLIAEFEHRGISSITNEETGEHITKAQAEIVVYDPDALVKALRRARKLDVLERIIVEQVDMAAVAAEVQAGNIPPRIVAQCSSLKKNAPYITGSR